MKKFLAFLLAFAMIIGITACSVSNHDNAYQTNAPQGTQSASLETESPGNAHDVSQTDQIEESFTAEPNSATDATNSPTQCPVNEDGHYTTKDDVALYIHLFGHLPDNFMTKSEARELGWEGGGLDDYADSYCIGGDRFGNYEGLLPQAEGRFYTECDIDTMHQASRGAKRIVFSNDGLIYYTDDHYESFTLLYGTED